MQSPVQAQAKDPVRKDSLERVASLTERLANVRPSYVDVPVRMLVVDPVYQRELMPARVRQMASAFAWPLFEALIVSRRKDGRFYVIDGQHRLAALRARIEQGLESPDISVPCHVLSGLTPHQEAVLFAEFNTRRSRPKSVHIYKTQLAYGDPVAVRIQEIVREKGFELYLFASGKRPPGSIQAVKALQWIYERGGSELLGTVLATIAEAWGRENHVAVSEPILKGMAWLLHTYRYKLNRQELVQRLARTDIRRIVASADLLTNTVGGATREVHVARALLGVYNERRRNKLPDLLGREKTS